MEVALGVSDRTVKHMLAQSQLEDLKSASRMGHLSRVANATSLSLHALVDGPQDALDVLVNLLASAAAQYGAPLESVSQGLKATYEHQMLQVAKAKQALIRPE